jgi:AraC-like DNA-binding protein
VSSQLRSSKRLGISDSLTSAKQVFDKSLVSIRVHPGHCGSERPGLPEFAYAGPGFPQQLPIVVAELFRAVSRTLEHERESAVEQIERATAILGAHSLPAMPDSSSQISSNEGAFTSPDSQRRPPLLKIINPLCTSTVQDSFDEIYVNAISIATVTRLICTNARSVPLSTKRYSTGLQKWRLKRVIDYVDTRLAETVTLASMAKVAGLTRMHFARQFKAATGIRPHEYVLRRRIERAKELLRNSRFTLVDVALSVGFQTQPHFTTVFKRFVGRTPHRWRTSIAESAVVESATDDAQYSHIALR